MNATLFSSFFLWLLLMVLPEKVVAQSDFSIQNVTFESQNVSLTGSILIPKKICVLIPNSRNNANFTANADSLQQLAPAPKLS